MYDLLLKNGTIIDPGQSIRKKVMDIAVKNGRIASLNKDIPVDDTKEVLYLKGKLVIPGLIDFHTHVYWGGTFLGIKADQQIRKGVTTFIDAGSAGAGNFLGFKEHIIDCSTSRIYSFLHIAYTGIIGAIYRPEDFVIVGEMEDVRYGIIEAAIKIGEEYPDLIVGIKVRASLEASGDQGLEPVRLAIAAAEQLNKPVMVHVNVPPPTIQEVLTILREGDILTHSFRGFPNSLLDENDEVRAVAVEARERGVIFDSAHGGGSFSLEVTKKLLQRNFMPDIISSDLHSRCIEGPAYDLLTTMSKMLNLGMNIDDIVEATTWKPATVISLQDKLGVLQKDTVADISVLEIEEGEFEFYDGFGNKSVGNRRFKPVLTIIAGEVFKQEDD